MQSSFCFCRCERTLALWGFVNLYGVLSHRDGLQLSFLPETDIRRCSLGSAPALPRARCQARLASASYKLDDFVIRQLHFFFNQRLDFFPHFHEYCSAPFQLICCKCLDYQYVRYSFVKFWG